MSFGKRIPSGELIDPKELYDEPGIDGESFRVDSKKGIRPFFNRHPKLQRGIAIGLTGLTLGLGIVGCGRKSSKSVSAPQQPAVSAPANSATNPESPSSKNNQSMSVSEPIAIAEPGEISPKEINAIRNDIGGLAKVDYRGWIYPNNVDGTPGHYKYDFSNPEQVILAYVEAAYNRDANLEHIVLGDPMTDAESIYWYLFKSVEENGENDPKKRNDFEFMQYVYDIISGKKNTFLNDDQKRRLSEILDEYNTERTSLVFRKKKINSYRIGKISNKKYLDYALKRLDETFLSVYRERQEKLGFPSIEDVKIARLEINNTPSEYIDLTLVKINGKYVVSVVTFFD